MAGAPFRSFTVAARLNVFLRKDWIVWPRLSQIYHFYVAHLRQTQQLDAGGGASVTMKASYGLHPKSV